MITAFGRAMMATINGQPQTTFRMTMEGGQSIEFPCIDFVQRRPDEDELLEQIRLPKNGVVVDWGCGIGRHLLKVRQLNPSVYCYGIEICDLMVDHCRRTIAPPAFFVQNFDDLAHCQLDLALLMGNGLGVLGEEKDAVKGLQMLVSSLAPGGRILIETGNPFGYGYFTPRFTIEYKEYRDGPFVWGYSDRDWLKGTLESLGCTVKFKKSKAPGGMFFFAIAQKD